MTAAAAGAAAAGRAVRRFLGRIQTIRNLVQRFLRPAEQFIRPNLLKAVVYLLEGSLNAAVEGKSDIADHSEQQKAAGKNQCDFS